jgi:hypothetical protein
MFSLVQQDVLEPKFYLLIITKLIQTLESICCNAIGQLLVSIKILRFTNRTAWEETPSKSLLGYGWPLAHT